MKSLNHLLVLGLSLVLTSPSVFARAGGIGDGGGQSVVCRDSDGSVVSAELLDLYEARNYFLLDVENKTGISDYLDLAKQRAAVLDQAIPRGGPANKTTTTIGSIPVADEKISYDVSLSLYMNRDYNPLQNEVIRLDNEKRLLPGDLQIPAVLDSNPRVLPSKKSCSIEQVAIYKDGRNEVHFVEAIWEKLDATNKAALLIHEALYREMRLKGDINSDRTRKLVGYLFGDRKFTWVLDEVPGQFLSCWSTDAKPSFMFVVYPSSNQDVVNAQFLIWNGEAVMSKIKMTLSAAPFSDIFPSQTQFTSPTTIANQLNEPLLEINSFAVTYVPNKTTGKIDLKIQSDAGIYNLDDAPLIKCNRSLTEVEVSEGSVNIRLGRP